MGPRAEKANGTHLLIPWDLLNLAIAGIGYFCYHYPGSLCRQLIEEAMRKSSSVASLLVPAEIFLKHAEALLRDVLRKQSSLGS